MNPFLPARIERERAVLGAAFVEGEPVWSQPVRNPDQPRPNVLRIVKRLEPLLEQLQSKLSEDADASEHDLRLYEDAAIYLLYERHHRRLFEAGFGGSTGKKNPARWRFYAQFLADWQYFFPSEGVRLPSRHDPCHTFACFRQLQRAFELYFVIRGSSLLAARLRASVWQSIFTHDLHRYRRSLYAYGRVRHLDGGIRAVRAPVRGLHWRAISRSFAAARVAMRRPQGDYSLTGER